MFNSSSAQITITDSDLISVGDIIEQVDDISPNSTINVGTAGANKFWDFSSLQIVGSYTQECISPSSTPYSVVYPNSNVAWVAIRASSFGQNQIIHPYYQYGYVTPKRDITLPANPSDDDVVYLHIGELEFPNVRVLGNGNPIMGLTDPLEIDSSSVFIKFIFKESTSTGWAILT